ncbi:TOBE domain protein [Zymomonas mobilis subsp. mobilis ZM4 = ATCC 31821]|uniref:TOBE domain protein n=2 Tax=Zymomonas mobilis subsp. mobilis TaxID=120045 RepID=Q5NLE8_ZYMMO|nr:TOBE domain-containing protein [Zymomonas mobilis]AAV90462.1 TOBE domain protein [Zymomonas mobilis subsp. mobilis ZM4 = ATCC 31821]ACV75936.1 TOBE domain protein [Zymomonas mobilis subsp. mobilis NCIMB 11163]AEH63139.1 TOBE domain protein [Zymomonas mobilis subsp. mobilis ATCC 10988]AHB10623.1 molybdenum-pterin binding domain protein [Zymomonas mobilis subsp. mobilis str. CP4 = NRRL B-14023]AHJ70935.1 Molybdopterin-binding protein [Zymomonas mobilis subsp. mobilis NRRL B-12526]
MLKLSARNQIKGKIIKIAKGATTSHITLDAAGTTLMASITNEAVEDLKLEEGKLAVAVIKASDIMVGIEA